MCDRLLELPQVVDRVRAEEHLVGRRSRQAMARFPALNQPQPTVFITGRAVRVGPTEALPPGPESASAAGERGLIRTLRAIPDAQIRPGSAAAPVGARIRPAPPLVRRRGSPIAPRPQPRRTPRASTSTRPGPSGDTSLPELGAHAVLIRADLPPAAGAARPARVDAELPASPGAATVKPGGPPWEASAGNP